MMMRCAIIAIRPFDQNIDEICSNESMITEKITAQISQENISAGFQPQT